MIERDEVVAFLRLVEINTTEGPFRFILGTDGAFTDSAGHEWIGSTILSGSENTMVIGDTAPRGSLTVRFMQDPSLPDIVAQMKELGADYVARKPVRFFLQRFFDLSEVGAPVEPPVLLFTRQATGLTFNLEGPATRAITLSYEGIGASGNMQRRMVYNTTDHARLIGRENPSLQYIPQAEDTLAPLFG